MIALFRQLASLKRTLAILLMLGLTLAPTITQAQSLPNGSYTTTFPVAQTPISEGGVWSNGKTNGVDWSDVAVSPGLAYGTQPGGSSSNDSIAVIRGTFAADQEVKATVVNNVANDTGFAEIELFLRANITAHSATGYEIGFSTHPGGGAYCGVVRWNGPTGNWTSLTNINGASCAIHTGSVISATAIGNKITFYNDGVALRQITDNALVSGNPGMGFFAGNVANNTYGLSAWSGRTLGSATTPTVTSTSTPVPAATMTPAPSLTPTPVPTSTVAPCRALVSINGGPDQYVNQPNGFCGLP